MESLKGRQTQRLDLVGGRTLEQFPVPHPADELPPREDGYAVDFARTGFVCHEDAVAERAFVTDGAKPLEVVPCGVAGRLRLDCDISVHHEINLKVGARAPICDFRIASEGVGVGCDLMHDPAFEGVSVFGCSANEFPAPRKAARHARVEQVEFRRLDRLAGSALAPYRDFSGEAREKG